MPDICGVLLAAGAASRYGSNKLLAEHQGQALILHALRGLAGCDRLYAVIRGDSDRLRRVLVGHGITCVVNPQPERGIGYSVACGIAASRDSAGWCLLPGDMPFIQPTTATRIIAALRDGALLAAPSFQGRRGHPVGFSAQLRDELLTCDGDVGARQVVDRHRQALVELVVEDAGILRDIDTPADLARDGMP